jgi:hypothetical protein
MITLHTLIGLIRLITLIALPADPRSNLDHLIAKAASAGMVCISSRDGVTYIVTFSDGRTITGSYEFVLRLAAKESRKC